MVRCLSKSSSINQEWIEKYFQYNSCLRTVIRIPLQNKLNSLIGKTPSVFKYENGDNYFHERTRRISCSCNMKLNVNAICGCNDERCMGFSVMCTAINATLFLLKLWGKKFSLSSVSCWIPENSLLIWWKVEYIMTIVNITVIFIN